MKARNSIFHFSIRRINRKLKQWAKVLTAGLILMVVGYGFFAFMLQSVDPRDWVNRPAASTYTPPAQTGQTLSNQQITITDAGKDTLDSSSSLTDALNYTITYWRLQSDGAYMLLGTGAAGTVTIETQPQDNGVIYASVEPRSGQHFYVDKASTKNNNPRLSAATFFDIDQDGYKEFVFPFSVAGLTAPIGSLATATVYPYFIKYGLLSDTVAADISTIGTAAVDEYIQWYCTEAAAKEGFAIVKVEFEVNTTDATKVELKQMNIPGVGIVQGDQFVATKGSTTTTYAWTVTPYNLAGANYLTLSTNQLNKFDFTTKVTCNLATSDVITATCNIYGIGETGTAIATITDTMNLSEA